jgi:uncharacterized metal-binding protein YceD (DUF177 family)
MEAPKPEFSRPVAVDTLGPDGKTFALAATADECAHLAERFGVDAVRRLEATVSVRPMKGGSVVVEGEAEAALTQQCVVTLAPVETRVTATFSLVYAEETGEDETATVIDIDPDAPDLPDPIVDGMVDVGEAVAEQIALGIDPFPRAEGAEFHAPDADEAGGREADRPGGGPGGPFADLAALKNKLERDD